MNKPGANIEKLLISKIAYFNSTTFSLTFN